jgi:hypothetical protein
MKFIHAILLLTLTYSVSAQTILSEASMVYEVKSVSKNNPTPRGTFQQHIWIKGHLSKSVFMSPSGRETVIYDARAKSGVILKEYAGQKILIELGEADWNDYQRSEKMLDFKQEKEQIKLGDYQCRMAVGTHENLNLSVWYTPNFKIAHAEFGLYYPALDGLPVQIHTCQQQDCLHYELKSLQTESIPSSVFEYNRKDYRVIQYKDAVKKG